MNPASEAAADDDREPWPKWRIRLARLSPYTIDIPGQLERLRKLTLGLTIVPAFMAMIVFTLLTTFGRPDVGAVAVCLIFGPMIAIAWWDYLRIARQARDYLARKSNASRESADRSSA